MFSRKSIRYKIKKEVYEARIKALKEKINKNAYDDEAKFKVTITYDKIML